MSVSVPQSDLQCHSRYFSSGGKFLTYVCSYDWLSPVFLTSIKKRTVIFCKTRSMMSGVQYGETPVYHQLFSSRRVKSG